MRRIWTICALAALLLACGGGSYEDDTSYEEQPGTFWQLEDDSEFTAVTEPWPPQAGPARLVATAGPGDWSEEPFQGTVEYRISDIERNYEDWVKMRKVASDDEWLVKFAADVTLPSGEVYLQFRIKSPIFDRPVELTDWSVEVQ